jgi:hypothetical protein
MNEREFATPKMLMGGFVVVVLVVFLPPTYIKKTGSCIRFIQYAPLLHVGETA